ncbi:MAG: SDR family oxidoreductase [Arthrobacter sp.]|jgi:NAD(P)-dependent dehydrogenase (short-subunit alcohol dehydrogenase family)|nr:SDR family oxidoreductase [Arthrobacter sp.]
MTTTAQPNRALESQTVLITGGSRGLGRAAALRAAEAGAGVILSYRSAEAEAASIVAEIEAAGGTAVALQLDTADAAQFPAFVESVRGALRSTWNRDTLNHLYNNAGTGLHQDFADTTESQLDALYNVHLKGVYLLTQALLPLLADGGSILNVSSGLARFTMRGSSAYAAMKGAIEVLTRYQALELGARGIRVNTIAPGAIATDFSGGMVRDNPQVQAMVVANTALGRVAVADDVAVAAVGLLSDASRWITGQRIEVSGGQGL